MSTCTPSQASSFYLRDILNDDALELVAELGKDLLELRDLALRAYGSADGEATLEQLAHKPHSDEAIGSGHQSLS